MSETRPASERLPLRTVGGLHARFVYSRRVRVLAAHLSALLPSGASVLDVGCGDGQIDAAILQQRPDVRIEGVDVFLRPWTHIPVEVFDGRRLDRPDGGCDVVMFVDVLHHVDDALALLREAVRVARRAVVIKDHYAESGWARLRLRFMDWVGNRPHGVSLRYAYWPRSRWLAAWGELGLAAVEERRALGLYPGPFRWVFERGLHFIARLERSGRGAAA